MLAPHSAPWMLHLPVTPMPPRDTICGLPGALSVIEIVPFKPPEALGMKITLIAQLAPDASVEPHVVVSPKLALATILAMLSSAVP